MILEDVGNDCLDSGISDIEQMAAIYKLESQGKTRATREALIGATKLSKRLPTDIKKMGQKKKDEYKDTFKKEYYKKFINNGMEQNEAGNKAEQAANATMDLITQISDAQSDIKKT